jgi:Zn ribbon nucleic-acid-binding protein
VEREEGSTPVAARRKIKKLKIAGRVETIFPGARSTVKQTLLARFRVATVPGFVLRVRHGRISGRHLRGAGLALVTEIPPCKHARTRLIAKDNEAEYIECVDCGAILETRELAETSRPEPAKPNPFDESLSDA